MNKCTERVYNGLIKENPTFVLMLGMCPTLAVTTSAINGVGMGLSTTVVLVLSNVLRAMLPRTRFFLLSLMELVWDLDLHLDLHALVLFVSSSEQEQFSENRFCRLQILQPDRAVMSR